MEKPFRRTTIKDIALAAGCSITTVSRYINKNDYVSKESEAKIESVIKELGYIPNTIARNLVKRKNKLIGLAISELNNPFLGELLVKLEYNLHSLEYSVQICNTGFDPRKSEAFINDLLMRNAEGVIVIATDINWSEEFIKTINQSMSTVSIGQEVPTWLRIVPKKSKTILTISCHFWIGRKMWIHIIGINISDLRFCLEKQKIIKKIRLFMAINTFMLQN